MDLNVIDFLNKVRESKKTFKYTSGERDYETIKYENSVDGKTYYVFSQFEENRKEPYYTDIIPDYEMLQILSSDFRDYENAEEL